MLLFTNNASGTLSGAIGTGDTTINLTAGHGARFPAADGAGKYFYATLIDLSNNIEIIKVTNRSTDALTVVRGQDGTPGRAYSSGDKIELRWCNADILAAQQEAVQETVATGTDTYAVTLSPAPTAYNQHQVYAIKFPNTNTISNPTINANSFGAKTIKKGNSKALAIGDIPTNSYAFLAFDGTDMLLMNPATGIIRGKQAVPFPAAAMRSALTNGASGPLQIETATNKVLLNYWDFDPSTNQYVQFAVKMPKSWDLSTFTARFQWGAGSSSGDVIWGIQAVAVSDGDALDAAWGTGVEVTDTLINVADSHLSGATGVVTVAGSPAQDDVVYFRVYRNAAAGGDTLAANARLFSVEIIPGFSASDDS